ECGLANDVVLHAHIRESANRGSAKSDCPCRGLMELIRKMAGNARKRALAKIVESPKTCANDALPAGSARQLISDAHARSDISVGWVIKRSAARGQGNCRGIGQASHSEGLVRQVLTLEWWIDVPAQSISQRESRRHFQVSWAILVQWINQRLFGTVLV